MWSSHIAMDLVPVEGQFTGTLLLLTQEIHDKQVPKYDFNK